MNDPTILQLYTQFVIFQQDATKTSLAFENPDSSTQDLLYALARKFGLEFKHTLQPAQVTLSKQLPAISLNPDVSCHDVGLLRFEMDDCSAPEPFTEQSRFSPGFHHTLPATPPDESMMAPDEFNQIDDNSRNASETCNSDQSQKYPWMDLFPNPADSPGPYQQGYGRGGPQYATFRQPAPRQRTAIACRYCRRRKVSTNTLSEIALSLFAQVLCWKSEIYQP